MNEKSKTMLSDLPEHFRRIRSFVRREGRALDATKIGADAGHELLLRLPQGVRGSL